ncbi:hypothetical protein [Agromyces sp. CCNWLW203]|uniref:hypothetical protein n=1 Tax=Agromyces sp. CCNWLW203 TaxID=3112842 RepID=UPI002F9643C6
MLHHVCPECGDAFDATRPAETCSGRCRQRRYTRRRHDRLEAETAARRTRAATLLALHSATIREGMALLNMDAVRPELDAIGAELETLVGA